MAARRGPGAPDRQVRRRGSDRLVVDVGLFNLLRFAGGEGPFYDKPLTAKVISVIVATTVAYIGNRIWTFSDRGRTSYAREYSLFFLLNGDRPADHPERAVVQPLRPRPDQPVGRQHLGQRHRLGPWNLVQVLVLPQVGLPELPAEVVADESLV